MGKQASFSLYQLACTVLAVAFILPLTSVHAQDVSYTDCSVIEFDAFDSSMLTREERLQHEEAILFASLDNSAKCMEQASNTAAESVASKAHQGATLGSGTGGAGEVEQPIEQTDEDVTVATDSNVASKPHEQGTRKKGSSAVCDAVKAGLSAATTAAEKEHFKGLMTDYGCKQ